MSSPRETRAMSSASADLLDFLLARLLKEGELIEAGANRPILLDDPHRVWVIEEGRVDTFSVRLDEQGDPIERRWVMASGPGDLLWGAGVGGGGDTVALLGVAAPGTMLRRLTAQRLLALAAEQSYQAQAAALVDGWLNALSRGVAGELRPATCLDLEVGRQLVLEPGACARAFGTPLWVRHVEGATFLFGDAELPAFQKGSIVPIAARSWLRADEKSRLQGIDTAAYLSIEPRAESLERFHRTVLQSIALRRRRERAFEEERLKRRGDADRAQLDQTFQHLASILHDQSAAPPSLEGSTNPLHAAATLVCRNMGIDLGPVPPAAQRADHRNRDPVRELARLAGARVRQVALRGDWWRGDHGPLLAFVTEPVAKPDAEAPAGEPPRKPVALIQTTPTRYEIHDPVTGSRARVSPANADSIEPFAYAFYRRLPHRKLNARDLFAFAMRGARRDLISIAMLGLGAALLALVTPLATGLIFDSVIPGAQRGQLLQVVCGLLAAELAIVVFDAARSYTILRVEGRIGALLQSAVWDRLLDLPAGFFRSFSAGDLTLRANGIDYIRRALSARTIGTMISGTFGLVSAGLLFYYDARLAWWAVALVAIAVAVSTVSGIRQVRLQRPLADLSGKIEGLVLQLINGVAKLRVAGAEQRAFARWAVQFSEQRKLELRARQPLRVFNAVWPVIATMVVYWALSSEGQQLSTGHFIAFAAAFGTFLHNTLEACMSVVAMLEIGPVYDRLRPVLESLPEIDVSKADPGALTGEIELAHLTFRYREDGPPVLDDVSLSIKPGEFVALVGGSGSGKSTLLRLLLGFEKPEGGTIYFNGQDLAGIDLGEVRRQIGVVLQHGKLITGDILSNIIGSSAHLTANDALEAARMAGFDQDLAQMPMGLHTVVAEGGTTLSGGQRQRLLIARAIVRRPRILFLDEATSALDNRTQAVVAESIDKLEATRVVIAHRLSTIINADRIVVMERGRIVQAGSYAELLKQQGPFQELARRQLA